MTDSNVFARRKEGHIVIARIKNTGRLFGIDARDCNCIFARGRLFLSSAIAIARSRKDKDAFLGGFSNGIFQRRILFRGP